MHFNEHSSVNLHSYFVVVVVVNFNAIHNVPESGHNLTDVACISRVPTHSNTVLTSSCLVKIKLS